jgi:PAS domain S-box-containing protein
MMSFEWNGYNDVKSSTPILYDSSQPVQSTEVLKLKKQNAILQAKIENLQAYLEAREEMAAKWPKGSFHLLLEAIAAPAVLTLLSKGTILAANQVFRLLVGVTANEVVGKSLSDTHFLAALAADSPALNNRRRACEHLLKRKVHLRTAKGDVICLNARTRKIKINEKTCALTLFLDSGESDRQEQSPEQGKTFFRRIARNFLNGVVVVIDQNLRLIVVEGAALNPMGLRRKQFEGKLITKLTEDIKNILHPKCHQELSDKSIRYETAFGGHFFLSNYVPIFEKTGKVKFGVIVATDITQLKQTEQELRKTRQDMEKRVRERTSELKARNKRLLHLSKEVKSLARKTITVMENDRKALAIELHDRIGGTLAAIIYQLEGRVSEMGQPPPTGEMPFERIIAHLREMIYETRRIAKQLRPSVLDDFGLLFALEETITDFKEFFPQMNIVRKMDFTEEKITDEVKIVLYRVIQESLNNAGRHSNAQQVTIRMSNRDKMVYLEIKDDGCGFNLSEVPEKLDPLSGYGLHSMKDRVELCKGRFHIQASPGNGTCIQVSIPVEPEKV